MSVTTHVHLRPAWSSQQHESRRSRSRGSRTVARRSPRELARDAGILVQRLKSHDGGLGSAAGRLAVLKSATTWATALVQVLEIRAAGVAIRDTRADVVHTVGAATLAGI